MKISNAGIALIKRFEGCELKAYADIVGVPTLGFGHTGPDVRLDMVISQEEADDLLATDLERFEDCVDAALTVDPTQGQFDALCAFAFNVGCKAMKGSTLVSLLNSGQTDAAAQQFLRWDRAGGKEIAGLKRRREAERELFLA